MQLATFTWSPGTAWSVEPLPPLDSEDTLVIAFGASELLDAPGPLEELARRFPCSHMVGCSTAGEICGTRLADRGLAVSVARFEHTRVATAFAPVHRPTDSFAAGSIIARALKRPDLRAILVFSDGLHVNGSELVRGIDAVVGDSVPVTGGLAGDGSAFKRTWVLREGVPTTGFVCAAGLYGERVEIGHGSQGGWDIFGPEREVTRSEGNVLYELDGRPALQIYKEYLGDLARGLPATALLFPLSLRANDGDEKALVRTVLAIDEETNSMTFAGDMPLGSLAQLMRANFDRLIDAAAGAARMTAPLPRAGDGVAGATLAIAVSCVGRRLVLGERTEEEIEATLEGLPVGTQQVGFYSYGEISPHASGSCDLHNQTMTLTTVREHCGR
ncbi:FIST C-terminal domain-containing protein [Myxococcota bacterium]|nr:FIST C-terminal domain-containing protein [Myxococcota bacterium]